MMTSYSKGFKVLHWLIALVVIPMLIVSFFLGELPDRYVGSAFMIHKSLGITILFLMLFRIGWVCLRGKPAFPPTMATWEKGLAYFVQYALYFFVILMPLCGWIMSVAANKAPYFFGLFQWSLPGIAPNKALAELMKQAHNTIAWIIIVLLIVHIAGALKHHFIDRDEVLRRILF